MLYVMLIADNLFLIVNFLFIKKIPLFIRTKLKNIGPLHRKLNRLPGQAHEESQRCFAAKRSWTVCVTYRAGIRRTHTRMIHVHTHTHTHVTTRIVLPTRPVYRHGMARLSERAGCYTSGNQDLFACGRPN